MKKATFEAGGLGVFALPILGKSLAVSQAQPVLDLDRVQVLNNDLAWTWSQSRSSRRMAAIVSAHGGARQAQVSRAVEATGTPRGLQS